MTIVVSYGGHDVVGDGFAADVPMLLVGALVSLAPYCGWLWQRPAGPRPSARAAGSPGA